MRCNRQRAISTMGEWRDLELQHLFPTADVSPAVHRTIDWLVGCVFFLAGFPGLRAAGDGAAGEPGEDLLGRRRAARRRISRSRLGRPSRGDVLLLQPVGRHAVSRGPGQSHQSRLQARVAANAGYRASLRRDRLQAERSGRRVAEQYVSKFADARSRSRRLQPTGQLQIAPGESADKWLVFSGLPAGNQVPPMVLRIIA